MEIRQDGEWLWAQAPAKVNLFLEVIGKRTDGFHELDSIFQTVEHLYDILRVRPSSVFSLSCNCTDIPLDESNLIIRAAKLLAEHCAPSCGAEFVLEKNIPDGGGLGGGSSDAATTLILCNQLWDCGLSCAQLLPLAAQVGSDVPFFLYGGVCAVGGRGEILTPFAEFAPQPLAILVPDWKVATPLAFSHLHTGNFGLKSSGAFLQAWSDGDIYSQSFNRFEEAVFDFEPREQELFELYRSYGCSIRMSGSGSCCWLLPDEAANSLPPELKRAVIFPPC